MVRSKSAFDQTTKTFWAIHEIFQVDQENVVTTINNQMFLVTQLMTKFFEQCPIFFSIIGSMVTLDHTTTKNSRKFETFLGILNKI